MILFLVVKIILGYKRGMVKELVSILTLLILCLTVGLLVWVVTSYQDKEYLNIIAAVFLLAVIGIVHHLIGLVLFPLKLFSALPIVKWLDKLCGILLGVAETIVVLWLIDTFLLRHNLGMIGQIILESTAQQPILTWFYEHNYLATWIEKLSIIDLFGQV
jgi:hypothetical protein